MYILATAALAAIGNTIWFLTNSSWQMPTWLTGLVILGSAAAVEALMQAVAAVRRRRARGGQARRRAHARTTPTTKTPSGGAA